MRAPQRARLQFALCAGLLVPYKIGSLLVGQDRYPAPRGIPAVLAVAAVVAVFALAVAVVLRRPGRRGAVAACCCLTVLAYGPYFLVGGALPTISAPLAAVVLLVFGGRARWGAAALVPAAEFAIRLWWLPPPGAPHVGLHAAWTALATGATGVLFFGVGRLALLVGELHAARARLAPLAAARERLRMARGVRAALGERLAVVLATARRAAADPDPAVVAETVRLARRALAEVRSVADEQGDRSLAAELAGARSVLAAAGVPVSVDGPVVEETALAPLLRRIVVAALQQGTPQSCRIELGAARMRVTFTGLPSAFPGLADTVAGVGGRLETGAAGDEAFAEVRVPRRPPAPAAGPVGSAPWLAFGVLLVYELDFFGTTVLNLLGNVLRATPAQFATAAVVLPLVAGLQLYHVVPRAGRPRAWRWTVLLQVAAIGTGLIVLGAAFPMPYTGLIAGVVLFHVRPPWSWAAAAALVYAPAPLVYGPGHSPMLVLAYAANAQGAVAVYALCRLPLVAREVDDARRGLARMAAVRERLRIARDVHDLLGFQLSAVALKGELAGRLLAADPGAARGQLAELAATAEQALATVRSITGDAAGLALCDEAAAARSMLAAAGIETRVALDDLPEDAPGPLLAVLLREAVTNVVRHSRATVCEIDVRAVGDAVRLRVANDGARASSAARRGNGLANLTARAAEAGGRLTVRRDGDRFTLVADLPLRSSPPPPRSGSRPPDCARSAS
ncbi:sensor histidine kinase [Actinomadura atramentaria]|uniref:sensor histidine kinase n=1 Tax=Actinomadura atramentaria TaxID=1990 RepID=UPI0003644D8D|nr:histidine kinase [Actinomadura atramentaria]